MVAYNFFFLQKSFVNKLCVIIIILILLRKIDLSFQIFLEIYFLCGSYGNEDRDSRDEQKLYKANTMFTLVLGFFAFVRPS